MRAAFPAVAGGICDVGLMGYLRDAAIMLDRRPSDNAIHTAHGAQQRLQRSSASAARIRVYVVESSSGSTRVSPVTVMKFASPAQRGNMCMCRCPVIPAPAA